MSDYSYFKIDVDGELTPAPTSYKSYSNFNLSEELMIEEGFMPFLPKENPGHFPVMTYIIPEDKIVVTFKNMEGKIVSKKVNYITQEYTDFPLDQYKEEKKREIGDLKLEKLDIGVAFRFEGDKSTIYHAQLDADGKANILGIKLMVADGKYNDKDSKISFKTFENIVVEFSRNQFLNLASAAFNYSEYVVFEKERIYREIDACRTVAALKRIHWKDPVAAII